MAGTFTAVCLPVSFQMLSRDSVVLYLALKKLTLN